MCKFISLVATKSKVFGDGNLDSHEDIIKQAKLDDSKPKELLTFCRVEITPKDNDIFNHNISNWVLKVDEERTPDWWSDKQEKMCLLKVKSILADKSIFLIGGEYEEINEDIRFVKDVKIKILKGTVQEVYDGGTVQKVWGGGTVQKVYDGGTVQKVYDGGTVQEVCDGGTVQKVWGGGTVQKVWGGGTVQKVYDGGTVQEVYDGGTVQEVCDGGTVQKVCDGGTVQKVWGGTVQKVYDGGTVQEVWGGANIIYFNEHSYLSLEKKEGGNNVLVKRWLKNVEVEIC
jgi:hypothetical protein